MRVKGYKQSAEWVGKRVKSRSWYHPSEESKKKMSEAKQGSKNPMFGRHLSEESKMKFRLSMAGYRHSAETRKKISEARLKFYQEHPEAAQKLSGSNNPMYGKISPMRGKHLSPESRLKLSRARMGRFGGKNNSFYGRHHSEATKSKMKQKWLARSFRQKSNRLETKLQESLKAGKIQFKTHVSLDDRPDIYIAPNICIFVDGCYWHGCPCKFNPEQHGQHASYIKSRIEHDAQINKKLLSDGFIVLRLKEHEINQNLQDCINKIRSLAFK